MLLHHERRSAPDGCDETVQSILPEPRRGDVCPDATSSKPTIAVALHTPGPPFASPISRMGGRRRRWTTIGGPPGSGRIATDPRPIGGPCAGRSSPPQPAAGGEAARTNAAANELIAQADATADGEAARTGRPPPPNEPHGRTPPRTEKRPGRDDRRRRTNRTGGRHRGRKNGADGMTAGGVGAARTGRPPRTNGTGGRTARADERHGRTNGTGENAAEGGRTARQARELPDPGTQSRGPRPHSGEKRPRPPPDRQRAATRRREPDEPPPPRPRPGPSASDAATGRRDSGAEPDRREERGPGSARRGVSGLAGPARKARARLGTTGVSGGRRPSCARPPGGPRTRRVP
ncbi:hypothetical protein FHX34_107355 [Actinoplanes teichomyceticus]|uniref:Uncharacterized protein n=1 Tax=Actinoplanes teichomyceticus TaxID=1867 RepID=A0A561VGX0_ACTTI|nr:hypothetical protein FHX34_107355 [Actinoplanes teichomyceticus]